MSEKTVLKIAALLPHTGAFGGVRRFIEMGNILVARGYAFCIYTPDGVAPEWIEYNADTRPLDRIEADSPDVVFCGDVGLLPRFVEMKARLKIMNLVGSRFADKYLANLRDDIVLVGNSAEWREYMPGCAGYTIAGGVNPEVFKPMNLPRIDDSFRIICFGRKSKKYKATSLVVEAFRRLRPRKNFRLVMFDSAEFRKPWFVRAETHYGLSQTQLAALYNTADLFVSAEWGAGWSNTSAEAMACGLPVICTPSGTKDFAIDGETAIVIPFESSTAIVEAIYKMKEDSALRRGIAEAGCASIQQFAWPVLCDKFEDLFREKGLL